LALEVSPGVFTGPDLTVLPRVAAAVSRACGLPIPANKPVSGADAFLHESGLHVDGVLRDASNYEPYDPALIGVRRGIVLGKHSGRSYVRTVLADNGVEASGDEAAEPFAFVKRTGCPVRPDELLAQVTAR
jgi:isopropylmalate/homocitrate/citramalate synthase